MCQETLVLVEWKLPHQCYSDLSDVEREREFLLLYLLLYSVCVYMWMSVWWIWRGVGGRGLEEEVEEHGCVPGWKWAFQKKNRN